MFLQALRICEKTTIGESTEIIALKEDMEKITP